MSTPSPLPPSAAPLAADRVEVPAGALARVQSHYDEGRYLDAHRAAEEIAPLRLWRGTRARLLAGRLAARLQGERLANYLIATAWRESPRDADALLYRTYRRWMKDGPLAAWEFCRAWEEADALTEELAGEFLALRAHIAAVFRDFELSGRLLAEAFARTPDSSWLWSVRGSVALLEERDDAAEEACGKSLELRPWFRPAVHLRAQILQKHRRRLEAAEWLREATERLQSSEVIAHRNAVLWDLDRHREAFELLDAFEAHAPLLEARGREWLAAQRCIVHCLDGAWERAAEQAEKCEDEYSKALAGRLRAPGLVPRRVRLAPPHIRQQHLTCGPSTLAMLAGFWGHPATHEAIAAAIGQDGTSNAVERRWCLDNGFAAREFRLTEASGRALIDAGIPCAVSTVEVSTAHLQAVVGYDAVRATFIIQDPSSLLVHEFVIDTFLEEYALHGPRALAIAPAERRAELDAVPLPEASLYDLAFEFHEALRAHRRDRAAALIEEVAASADPGAPRHLWHLRWALASYDDDPIGGREAILALRALRPDDPRLAVHLAEVLRAQGPRTELVSQLEESTQSAGAHPALWRILGLEMSADGRRSREAWRCLRRAHAGLPLDTDVMEAWGDLWWREGARRLAVDAYGFAATWAPADERRARIWFDATRWVGERDQALERLRARHRRRGERSADAARTLLYALDDLHHEEEARALLAAELARHPEDGPLLLDAARFLAARGEVEAARRHLEAAEARTPPRVWLRVRASLHDREGEHSEALALWRRVVEREPMAVDVHAAIVRLLAILEGDGAADAHLEAAVAAFPHHVGLAQLEIDRLRQLSLPRAEQAVRRLLASHPSHAWATRELAELLGQQGRTEEALAVAREGRALEPDAAAGAAIIGQSFERLGRREEACAAYREAIGLDVDYTFAHFRLVAIVGSAPAQLAELERIHAEIGRQTVRGPAIASYRELAFPLLAPDELLARLESLRSARSDLFEAWLAVLDQSIDLGLIDLARALAGEMTERFARVPGAWRAASRAHRLASDWQGALACARTACEIAPDWPAAWWTLADLLEDSGDSAAAVELLRTAIRRLPGASHLHMLLASICWRLGRRDEAFALAREVVVRSPDHPGAPQSLRMWGEALGRGEEVLASVRQVAAERPGEARSWMLLAETLPRASLGEQLAALDRAIALNPRLEEAYDAKAVLLASQGRFAEAEAACRPAVYGDALPHTLEGRSAWLLAQEGKVRDAVARMEEILERHPDYLFGWARMVEWSERLEDRERARRARAAILRLDPNSANALSLAAAGAHAGGDPREAERLYRRAMELAPGAILPLLEWLRLRWRARATAEIIQAARSALPGAARDVARAYEVLAAVHQGRRKDARTILDALLSSPEPIDAAVDDLAEGLAALGWRRRWSRACRRAVAERRIGMAFARRWVEEEVRARRWRAWRHFDDWIRRGHESAFSAIVRYFDLVGEQRVIGRAKGFFSTPAAAWVRERTLLLGKVSYALARAGWWSRAAEWLAGIEERDDAEGWICSNHCLALYELGREPEAFAVAKRCRERGLRDDAWPNIVAFFALGAALRGDVEEARRALAETEPPRTDSGMWIWAHSLARELLAVLAAPPAEARRIQRRSIRALFRLALKRSTRPITAAMARSHRATLRAMSRHTGARIYPWHTYVGRNLY